MDNYIQDLQTYDNSATMFACEVGISKELATIFVKRIPVPKQTNSAEYDSYYNLLFDSLEFLSEHRLFIKVDMFSELKEKFNKQYKPSKKIQRDSYFVEFDKKRCSFMKYVLFAGLRFPTKLLSLQKLHKISPLNSNELTILYEWLCPFHWLSIPNVK